MKHILFISYDGMTDPLGQSQVIPYLIGLAKNGYRFTILSCDKPDKFKAHHSYIKSILHPYPIKWIAIPYHKNPPVFSSVYDLLMMKRKAAALHKKDKFDLVHTRAGTPALVGLWMKKKYGIAFLNDLRDFYADSRIDSGLWKKNSFIFRTVYRFFKRKEEEAIEINDGVVCLTYKAEKIIKNWPHYKQNIPISVIPCSADLQLFNPQLTDPLIREKLKKNLKIENEDIVFSYLGSIGGWYLTDEMMAFFKKLNDIIPKAKFLFISPNQHRQIYQQATNFEIPENKIIITQAQRSEVPLLLSFSSYSVFFIKPCYSKQASSPTKHGEIMAMGIPAITNSGVGDVESIIKKYKSGIVLEKLNDQEYLKVANSLLKMPPFDKTSIRNGAKEYFDLKNAVNNYKDIYDLILKP